MPNRATELATALAGSPAPPAVAKTTILVTHMVPYSVGTALPAPVDAVPGQLFLKTSDSSLHFFDGAAWKKLKVDE